MADDHSLTHESLERTYERVLYAVAGLYLWEWLTSVDFEWVLIRRKKVFRWPLLVYFLNRYLMFATLAVYVLLINIRGVNNHACRGLDVVLHVCGSGTLGLASLNLAFRTVAIWARNRYVYMVVGIMMLAHWALIIAIARERHSDHDSHDGDDAHEEDGCTPHGDFALVQILFAVCMAFDFLILVLNVIKAGVLSAWSSARLLRGGTGTFKLRDTIVKHGLVFFVVSFVVNTVEIIFLSLDIDVFLKASFIVPAYAINTMVACRAVRALSNFSYHDDKDDQEPTIRYPVESLTTPRTSRFRRPISSQAVVTTSTAADEVELDRRYRRGLLSIRFTHSRVDSEINSPPETRDLGYTQYT